MNRNYRLLIHIFAATTLSLPVFAQDGTGAKSSGADLPRTLRQSVLASKIGALVPFEPDARNSDAAITALIRKKIFLERNLSANARNVMIITKDGRVLLRGAVITVREKQLIGDIAIGIQRRENVNNQLQVGLPPSAPTAFRIVP
jgi:hypothetical protein